MSEPPRETEIKLDLDPAEVPAVLALPALRDVPERSASDLLTTYYDSADGALRKAGLTLRVRAVDGTHRQTVKRGAHGAGVLGRDEWECAVAGPAPDRDALARTPAGEAIAEHVVLVPLFTLRVSRTAIRLHRDGTEMEVAVDLGTVEIEGAAPGVPFAEVEIELVSGAPGELFALARELAQAIPLRLGATTKAERGFAHRAAEGARAQKSEPVVLDPGKTAGAAFQAVAAACLVHLRRNEPLVLAARDPEALHQTRVALRRLRSAFSLFKPVADVRETRGIREMLRARIAVLGDARNLDVLLLQTLPKEMERRPDQAADFLALRARLELERAQAYDAVVAMLASADWRRLVIDVAALLAGGEWLRADATAKARETPVAEFAAEILERRRRRVKRRGRHLFDLAPDARHTVRIEAKKLRYGAEFFASLAEGRKGRRHQAALVDALSDLQDALGVLNDVETGRALLGAAAARAGQSGEGTAAFAAGLLTADREGGTSKDLKSAAKAYARFAGVKRFWEI